MDIREVVRRKQRYCGARRVQGIEINSSYCGDMEQNGPLVGTIPLESSPRIVFPGTRLTAVALANVDDDTVVFVGTSRGHVKKVRVRKNPRLSSR